MSPRRRIFPLFVPHIGCPRQCVFCDQREITGEARPVRGEDVTRALAGIPDGAGLELAFYGGSFTAVPAAYQEELLSAAAPARKRGAVAAIRVSTRPDAVDEETLERLKLWGVETVELGAQSMDDAVLARARRGHTAADTRRAAALVKAAGLTLILQMMTGLPGSSDERDIKTARELIALKPDGARMYPPVVLRGTELHRLWLAGEYREHTVEDAVRVCARILPLFEAAGIPVIRLGLNPSEELSGGEAVAGAYHPALGELVRSRILRERAETLLEQETDVAAIGVAPERLSAMIGQHRANLRYLWERFSLPSLRIVPIDGAGEDILLLKTADMPDKP